MDSPMLTAALEYIAEHHPVFPVTIQKTPYTEHGLKDATLLQIRVKEFWTRWPDAGIGMRTDGLIVLDFDPAKGGYESMAQMREKYGPFPTTRVHQTGGGGLHMIFTNPDGKEHRNAVSFAGYQGVDIRANGGYIVCPPSKHLSGNCYEVLDPSPIAPCPEWLVELLSKRGRPMSGVQVAANEPIIEGQRHATLVRIAGAMRRVGSGEEEIAAALMAALKRCDQPIGHEITEADMLRLAKDVYRRYEPEPFAEERFEGGEAYRPVSPVDPFPGLESAKRSVFLPPDNPPISTTSLIDREGGLGGTFDSKKVTNSNNSASLAHHSVTIVTEGNKGNNSNKGIALVKEWLMGVNGTFAVRDVWQELGITSKESKHYLRVVLNRLVEQGTLVLTSRDGSYRKVDTSMVPVDWQSADTSNVVDIRFPFGLEKFCKVYPKSVIVVAGSKNSGKTAFLYNIVHLNMNGSLPVDLFNSETGPEQMKDRMAGFDIPVPAPFTVYQRYDQFADVIHPEHLSVIDYLDQNSEVYLVGSEIDAIWRKLTTGVAVIGIQKAPPIVTFVRGVKKLQDRDLGYGGAFSAKRAVLYISLGNGKVKLVYVKTPANPQVNPNNMQWWFTYDADGVHFRNIRECHEEEVT